MCMYACIVLCVYISFTYVYRLHAHIHCLTRILHLLDTCILPFLSSYTHTIHAHYTLYYHTYTIYTYVYILHTYTLPLQDSSGGNEEMNQQEQLQAQEHEIDAFLSTYDTTRTNILQQHEQTKESIVCILESISIQLEEIKFRNETAASADVAGGGSGDACYICVCM